MSVTFSQNNSSYINASSLPFGTLTTSNLPAYCSVLINVVTSPTSSFNSMIWLPDNTWNRRFLMVGNGAFGGGLNYPDIGAGIKRGFASATTDTGHNSSVFDGTWANNNKETVNDWGYRAVHMTVVLSKQIIQQYYDASIIGSYFQGCSTGGRQGLKEIQDYPSEFNGILIGAPAWYTSHLWPFLIRIALHFLPSSSSRFIPSSLFPVIHNEVVRQCDGQDGVQDQLVSDPYACNLNLNTLLCGTMNKKTKNCLTNDQLEALTRLYSDYVDTNQTYVMAHQPYSSEPLWGVLLGQDAPNQLAVDFVRYFVLNDPNWQYTSFDYSIVQKADQLDPGNANANNYNLRPFFSLGGKVIHYQGLADGLLPPKHSQYYYDHVFQNLSDMNLDQYYRLFYVPGMGHCDTSETGPCVFGGNGQEIKLGSQYFGVPGFNDSQHDALLALVEWVENGKAPDQIIATLYVNSDPAQGVLRQRPLCPFPQKARYHGTGSIDDPANFYCAT